MSTESSVLSALAESLKRGEASTRGEGIDPDDNPAYIYVKSYLLSGEISPDEAHKLYEACFPPVVTEALPMPSDGKRKDSFSPQTDTV
jgi:hypothetical protein